MTKRTLLIALAAAGISIVGIAAASPRILIPKTSDAKPIARKLPIARTRPATLPASVKTELVASLPTALRALPSDPPRPTFEVTLATLQTPNVVYGSVWWARDIMSDWVDFNQWQISDTTDQPMLYMAVQVGGSWFVDCEINQISGSDPYKVVIQAWPPPVNGTSTAQVTQESMPLQNGHLVFGVVIPKTGTADVIISRPSPFSWRSCKFEPV